VAQLAAALHDEEPLVRGHAAWALGRIPDKRSVDALRSGCWPRRANLWSPRSNRPSTRT